MMQLAKTTVPLLSRFHTQLIILVLLVLAPVLILILHSNVRERRMQKQNSREANIATVKLAAAKQKYFVKNARQLLATVSQFSFLVSNTNRPFSQNHFINLRKLSPEYLDIGLIEADGTLFCSTVITNDSPKLSKWTCFARASETRGFAIGDLEKNGTTPDQETLDFGIPIFDEKGVFQRVLFASLDMSWLRAAAAEVDLPRGANIMVFDGNGTLLAQHSASKSNSWSGKSIADHPSVRRILEETEAVFEALDIEGVKKLFAVDAVSDGRKNRLWVTVGIPTKTIFASADEALRGNILIITIIALLALVAAYFYAEHFFLHPLRSLVSEARLLTAGKWVAHSTPLEGKGELAEMSRTFNEMAHTLEQHRHDLEAANAQLEQRVLDRTYQLEQTSRELEAFSYSVSHDLRAPLRHISGFVDLLRSDMGDSASQKSRRFLGVIADSAKQMGQLIDDLLVFSKMGRVEMQKTIVDTSELVKTVIAHLEPETKDRKIIWEISALPKLQADPSMLRQVFANLIFNAIKYSRPRDPARIEIGHQVEGDENVIFIRDNGVGFDMQFADKLFGVFQRLHQADEFEGTGIGLANVRRIIHRHGGRTWAEGKVDEGATFYFSLPKPNQ